MNMSLLHASVTSRYEEMGHELQLQAQLNLSGNQRLPEPDSNLLLLSLPVLQAVSLPQMAAHALGWKY